MLSLVRATRRFGRRTVFAGLDLDVAAGERVLLAGPNGAGKTTLLRCLSGTLALSAGRAAVAGHPVGSPGARRATGVCLAPEQGLYDRLTARQNITLVARLRLPRRAVRAAVTGIEEEFGVTRYAEVPAGRCSAGMRARSASPGHSSAHPRCCCSTSRGVPSTTRVGGCSGRLSTDGRS